MKCESCHYPIDCDAYQENDGLCLTCWEHLHNTNIEDTDENDTSFGCTQADSCVPYTSSTGHTGD